MDGWWDEIDDQVLACLSTGGPMSPGEVGRRLGVSERTAISVICLLAQEGRVAIRLVDASAEAVRRIA